LSAKDFSTLAFATRRHCSNSFKSTFRLLAVMRLASLLEVARLVRTQSVSISSTTTTPPRAPRHSSPRLFSSREV
jgi:hypothetical protein